MTAAAAKLHMAQPALSQNIASLEAAIGIRLLERHARGVRLTGAGAALLEKAKLVLSSAREAEAALGPWLRGEGTFAIGFSPGVQPIARPILRRFAAVHPRIEAFVRHLDPSTRLVELKAGAIDAEIVFPPPPDEDLYVETIASHPRYALLPSGHRLAGEEALMFDQIAGETFPGRHPSVSEQWAEEAWLSNRRGHDPPVTRETPVTLEAVWALIYSGKAIAVLPEFMVTAMAGDGVCAVPVLDVDPMEIGLARRRDDDRRVLASLFDVARQLRAVAV